MPGPSTSPPSSEPVRAVPAVLMQIGRVVRQARDSLARSVMAHTRQFRTPEPQQAMQAFRQMQQEHLDQYRQQLEQAGLKEIAEQVARQRQEMDAYRVL